MFACTNIVHITPILPITIISLEAICFSTPKPLGPLIILILFNSIFNGLFVVSYNFDIPQHAGRRALASLKTSS